MDLNHPYISDPVQFDYLKREMHGKLKYTLMNDFLSKYSLQKDLFALKGLLAALLFIDLDDITAIEILNPIEPGEVIGEKDCILDIKLELNHKQVINIEIQSRYQDFWPERSLTYLCRNFNHLTQGSGYGLIKPCIHIGILSNDMFKEDDPRYTGNFYSEYHLLETGRHTEYSSKFTIRVLSLNQLEKATEADKKNPNGLYQWAKLFRASSWEELIMTASTNERMQSFVGTVRQLTAEEKVAEACERRLRYSNDIATYEQYISDRDARIAEQNEIIAKNDEVIAGNAAKINDQTAKIDDQAAKIDDQAAKIDDQAAEIIEKDKEIAQLKAQLAALLK